MALIDNLQAYWKLDESSGDAADATGNGYTLTNTNTVGYAAALINNGADFGTANTNKRLLSNTVLGITSGTAFSISMWVKIRTAPGTNVQYTLADWRWNAATDTEMWFRYEDSGGTKRVRFMYPLQDAGSLCNYNVDFGTTTWQHCVGTFDGTTIRMYINGTQQGGDVAATAGGSTLTDAFCLAATGNGFVFSSMYTDEVGIWSRAITSTEVTSLYNSGAGLAYPFSGGATINSNFFALM